LTQCTVRQCGEPAKILNFIVSLSLVKIFCHRLAPEEQIHRDSLVRERSPFDIEIVSLPMLVSWAVRELLER